MCTVTYLPLQNNNFILTSSRDIPYAREKALAPKTYIESGVELTYPKDGKEGGTWIGYSQYNRLMCLLNGGFHDHIPKQNYRKSRGLIVKELLSALNIDKALKNVNLNEIEPFTLVICDWNDNLRLIEFVWDGEQKHTKNLPQKPHIWSSSTLYDEATKQLRRDWFASWQKEGDFVKNDILQFHKTAGIGNPTIDVMMDRDVGGTVSLTCVEKRDTNVEMDYQAV